MKTTITYILLAVACISLGLKNTKDLSTKHYKTIVATDTLQWYTEFCDHTGTFDKSKYTKKNLKDTYKLWYDYNSLLLSTKDTETDPDEYTAFDSRLQLRELGKEYLEKKMELKSLALVKGNIWEELRQNRLKSLEEWYELLKINLEAHSNPEILLNNRFTPYCTEYAEALASNDTVKLIACWGKLMSEIENHNFSQALFDNHNNSLSPEARVIHAKSYILAYGWHNCANRHINHETPNVNYREEFEKLFISIEKECDEP